MILRCAIKSVGNFVPQSYGDLPDRPDGLEDRRTNTETNIFNYTHKKQLITII